MTTSADGNVHAYRSIESLRRFVNGLSRDAYARGSAMVATNRAGNVLLSYCADGSAQSGGRCSSVASKTAYHGEKRRVALSTKRTGTVATA